MNFADNPFYILGVSLRDNKEKIIELAQMQILITGETTKYEKAKNILLNPRLRLDAELGWFIGNSPAQVNRLIQTIKDNPSTLLSSDGFSCNCNLSYCNTLSSVFETLTQSVNTKSLTVALKALTINYAQIDTSAIWRMINEDRQLAGIPIVQSAIQIDERMQDLFERYANAAKNYMGKNYSLEKYAAILIDIVNCDAGNISPLTVEIIERSKLNFIDKLSMLQTELYEYCDAIEEEYAISEDESEQDFLKHIRAIITILDEWDKYSLPFQIADFNKGNEEEYSLSLARRLRELSLNLHNDFDATMMAQQIAKLSKERFKYFTLFADIIEQDKKTLDRLALEYKETAQIIKLRDEINIAGMEIMKKLDDNIVHDVSAVSTNTLLVDTAVRKFNTEMVPKYNRFTGICKSADYKELLQEVADTCAMTLFVIAMSMTWANQFEQAEKTLHSALSYKPSDEINTEIHNKLPKITESSKQQRYDQSENKQMNATDNSGTGCVYIILAAIAFIAIGIFYGLGFNAQKPATTAQTPAVQSTQQKNTTPTKPVPTQSKFVPVLDKPTGYDPQYPRKNTSGICELTIDNSKNDFPVHVKLSLSNKSNDSAVRVFYVQKGETFKINKITPGSYIVKYQNLQSGSYHKTDVFSLQQTETSTGTQYSSVRFTLYTVRGGNTRMQGSNKAEFDS